MVFECRTRCTPRMTGQCDSPEVFQRTCPALQIRVWPPMRDQATTSHVPNRRGCDAGLLPGCQVKPPANQRRIQFVKPPHQRRNQILLRPVSSRAAVRRQTSGDPGTQLVCWSFAPGQGEGAREWTNQATCVRIGKQKPGAVKLRVARHSDERRFGSQQELSGLATERLPPPAEAVKSESPDRRPELREFPWQRPERI